MDSRIHIGVGSDGTPKINIKFKSSNGLIEDVRDSLVLRLVRGDYQYLTRFTYEGRDAFGYEEASIQALDPLKLRDQLEDIVAVIREREKWNVAHEGRKEDPDKSVEAILSRLIK